jgi:DNA-directed RNA polymerases I and III subunit RPAC1
MHAVKGIGQDHAKFSPVCIIQYHTIVSNLLATASYRLLPTIDILSPITGNDAEKFVNCFPSGVAQIKVDKNGVKQAEIVNPRLDTVSREVLRHDEFKDRVKLGRVRDHFICTTSQNFITNAIISLCRKHWHPTSCRLVSTSRVSSSGKMSKIEIRT